MFLVLLSSAIIVSLLPASFWVRQRVGVARLFVPSHGFGSVAELPLFVLLPRLQSLLYTAGHSAQRAPQRQYRFALSRRSE